MQRKSNLWLIMYMWSGRNHCYISFQQHRLADIQYWINKPVLTWFRSVFLCCTEIESCSKVSLHLFLPLLLLTQQMKETLQSALLALYGTNNVTEIIWDALWNICMQLYQTFNSFGHEIWLTNLCIFPSPVPWSMGRGRPQRKKRALASEWVRGRG